MRLLLLILKDESLLNPVSAALLEVGLYDATVLDGEGIDGFGDVGMPLFASFKGLFGTEYSYNRSLFIPVSDHRQVKEFLKICRSEGIDLANPSKACLLSMPAVLYDGTPGDEW
jgi:hypothetical protein